jgi:hypothetical protein
MAFTRQMVIVAQVATSLVHTLFDGFHGNTIAGWQGIV